MGMIRIRWGRFRLEVPGNMIIPLLIKLASWLFHNVST